MRTISHLPSVEAMTRRAVNAQLRTEADAATATLLAELRGADAEPPPTRPAISSVTTAERSANPLRPNTLDQMVGQERLKPLLREIIAAATRSGRPMDHMLLTGASGTGKSTVAHVIANELGHNVYMLDAPVTSDMLLELRDIMHDGDVLFVDEIHRQVMSDRRGVTAAAAPEVFYHVMEDRRLITERGVLPFPAITIIGATTDAGLLPEPFIGRFPLRPRLARYTVADMTKLAQANARQLKLQITPEGALMLARASRSNPRVMNQYVRNAQSLNARQIDVSIAVRIVVDLNDTTLDGLTGDMAAMLRFLLVSGRRKVGDEVRYQASVNTIATALGKSRDTKAIALYVEPWLIEQGLVQVAHGGRTLTEPGVARALAIVQQEVKR